MSSPANPLPALNPALDPAPLAKTFADTGRLHIPGLLTEPSAARLFHALHRETPWSVIYNEGMQTREFASLPLMEYERALGGAIGRARTTFQYFYHFHRMLQDRNMALPPEHYLARTVEFLSSEAFLAFIRQVTGISSIVWLSATATLYRPLNFLKIHDDNHERGKRMVAFVLNMTPEWNPDWGGALQFYGRPDLIEESWLPSFNALNLFRVPKFHSVGQVAAFGGARYAISGWFEAAQDQPLSRAHEAEFFRR